LGAGDYSDPGAQLGGYAGRIADSTTWSVAMRVLIDRQVADRQVVYGFSNVAEIYHLEI
jgi:hypothetical protein